ncbi:LptF/LptG family permease [Hansschlegelia zhihuaiae]|uniref:YjgP/YjgQ family permease n=1 Tax=Hansschlegelia zhihuaiae TaxID=405005 RepID=A0A4V1KJV5_9HYPH|nr:LptF/LptG family permease [Hansschlegelia zhihuaiae]RXF75512.1 YjgP/YjgQ family permease [Hansschlegelia zhihuaiae]
MTLLPRMRILDRYVLALTLKPMMVSLGVVLMALLLERILRLIDILATAGAPIFIAFALAGNLVPHYLGFAMPAGFALGVYSAISKLSAGAELEAGLASGVSVRSIVRPLIALGVVLSVVSIVVVGYLSPLCRYAYREIINQSVSYAWRAHAPAATFISVKDGLTITADEVDKTGRNLKGVFIQNRENGVDVVTSAATGSLELTPDKTQIQLRLKNGAVVRDYGAERPSTLRFQDFILDRKFDLKAPPFRERGGSERELTMTELWNEMDAPLPSQPREQLAAEFHSRLARSLSLIFLPLLIVPLSMTMRRNTRIVNMAAAAIMMVVCHNALQIGETLADKGLAPAWIACWSPFVLFLGIALILFRTSTDRPGDTIISRAIDGVSDSLSQATRRVVGRFRTAEA